MILFSLLESKMSCSNPFVCGMRKYDQHKISTNSPNNPALYRENEKQLEDLLRLRQQQDQGIYSAVPLPAPSKEISLPSVSIPSIPSNGTYYPLSG